ncbi:MAG: DUF2520 domain-containing protein [Bacteroidetes bacterium]|nr:DUF2520 domain-containing protein [Bacteroidota bacterium]
MTKTPKKTFFNVVLIGAGNVATHLAMQLIKRKHHILQIVSRSKKSGSTLSKKTKTAFTTDIKKINKTADIYIICSPDDAIEKIANQLSLSKKIILHTSGSTSIDILKESSANVGVLYPLQSFSKEIKTDFSSVPILIEANNNHTLQAINTLASTLSTHVIKSDFEHRIKLHLAATMVNNFGNYLLALTYHFLEEDKADFSLLFPLIKQTSKKIEKQTPFKVQTGAARRGDKKTITKHLNLLKKYPEQKKIYTLFTQLIKQHYER